MSPVAAFQNGTGAFHFCTSLKIKRLAAYYGQGMFQNVVLISILGLAISVVMQLMY
jgi:hypothetical protein